MASGGRRGIAGRGSSLYRVFKSAKSVECSFYCDAEGKGERCPALLATPRLEASPRGQGEPPEGLVWGDSVTRFVFLKIPMLLRRRGGWREQGVYVGDQLGGCRPSGRWWLLGRGMGRSGGIP